MSSLDRCALRGIRSFDHLDLQVLQFYSPLTLIIGQNGTGKTTVIESLLYATCGAMPPNSRNGAFVQSPEIAGENTVNGEVKLRFHNASGELMVVDRRLQVTKKKTGGGQTMKTLEGSLSYEAKGDGKKRATISTKCSELDEEVPQQLGVSKAILENVIFCHQEESNWPLSEPSVLKKKFDEIFEASKYTKALDQIKAIRKEQAIDIKVDKERLASLKVDRERANKLAISIETLAEQIESKLAEDGALEAEIQTLSMNNSKFYDQAAKHSEIVQTWNSLREKLNVHNSAAERLRQGITELRSSESEAELKTRLANHDATLQTGRQRISQEQQRLTDEETTFQGLQSKQLRRQGELGRAQADLASYERLVSQRLDLVRSLSVDLAIDGYDRGDLKAEDVESFVERLSAQLASHVTALETLRSEAEHLISSKSDEIMRIRADESAQAAARKAARDANVELRGKITRLKASIEAKSSSESEIEAQDRRLQEQRIRLETATAEFRAAKYDATHREKGQAIVSTDAQREALHAELSGLNRQADTRAKLAIKKADKAKADKANETAVAAHGVKFRQIVGRDIARASVEADIASVANRKEQELSSAERSATSALRDSHAIEAELTNAENQLQRSKRAVEDRRRRVHAVTEGRPLQELLQEAREEVEARRNVVETIEYSERFFTSFLKQGRDSHACSACSRPFSKADEEAKFAQFCNDQIKRAPETKRNAEEELTSWSEEIEKLVAVQSDDLIVTQLEAGDVPRFEKEVADAKSHQIKANERSAAAQTKVEGLKQEVADLANLRRVGADIARNESTIRDLNREISQLEKDLEITGSTQTADDIQKRLDSLARDLENLRREQRSIESVRSEKAHEMQQAEKAILNGEVTLSNLRHALSEVVNTRAKLEEAQTDLEANDAKQKACETRVNEMREPLNALEDERRALQNDFRGKRTTAEDDIKQTESALREMDRATKEVAKYRNAGTGNAVHVLEGQLQDIDGQLAASRGVIARLRESIEALKEEASKSTATKRNLTDNIELRQHKSEASRIENEIADLDVEGAKKAKRRFDEDYERARREQADLASKHARLGGEIETSKRSLQEKRQELKSEYKDIHESYRAQLIKVKVGELSNTDLEKYGKALDTAIMKYHEHKMREINDSIQALWSKTYQGTDVDTIMIKSDNEGAKGTRGVYNYRVVMLKDKVELDMRGRCSAGQKVLASIIIRLALAESFGTNCGILALDEPTTNLDRDNVVALAHALAECVASPSSSARVEAERSIIKDRSRQENFQLIIITHDEELLNLLSGSLQKYWRISRDPQMRSRIMRQRVDV